MLAEIARDDLDDLECPAPRFVAVLSSGDTDEGSRCVGELAFERGRRARASRCPPRWGDRDDHRADQRTDNQHRACLGVGSSVAAAHAHPGGSIVDAS
jgi:hypothetical protein